MSKIIKVDYDGKLVICQSAEFSMRRVLKDAMKDGQIKPTELARKIGVTPRTVSNWVNGSSFSADGIQRALLAMGFVLNLTLQTVGDHLKLREERVTKLAGGDNT